MYYILSLIRYFINAACKTIMLLCILTAYNAVQHSTYIIIYCALLLYIRRNLSLMMCIYFVCTYRFKHIRMELLLLQWKIDQNREINEILVTTHHHCPINTLCTNNFLSETYHSNIEAIKLDYFQNI